MEFILNGQKRTYDGDPDLPLLTYLREIEGITSPKDGCAPSGQCGCCVVLVNGRAVTSCTQSVDSVAGKEVVTLEGVDDAEVERYARAFASRGALQCGFCTPGIILASDRNVSRFDSTLPSILN